MYIFFSFYKKSFLATLLSISGSVCLAIGIYALFEREFLPGLIYILVGAGLLFIASKVNKAVIKRKLEKSLKDPKLIEYVQKSSLAAYSLFKNDPSPFMLKYIAGINPYAAALINQLCTNQITETVLISMLTQHDAQNGSIILWNNVQTTLYHNNMFSLNLVVESNSEAEFDLKKKIKRNETKKALTIIGIVVLITLVFTVIIISTTSKNKDDDPVETNAEITEVTECEHTYEETIYNEAGYGITGKKGFSCTKCHDYYTEDIPALPSIFNVHVTNKESDTYSYEENGKSFTKNVIIFYISIENTSDKTIEQIEGTLVIDCNGSELRLESVFDEIPIEPYSTTDIGAYVCDYDPELYLLYSYEEKIYNAEYEDLTFSFEPTKVITSEQ
ncbi:MAG: hypothetical protein E7536_10180 [Ruminococcaceae bacterium]|nr:hypothetical protein [Oscillospiraceae bacterium]